MKPFVADWDGETVLVLAFLPDGYGDALAVVLLKGGVFAIARLRNLRLTRFNGDFPLGYGEFARQPEPAT